jgi:hypothetical protein
MVQMGEAFAPKYIRVNVGQGLIGGYPGVFGP